MSMPWILALSAHYRNLCKTVVCLTHTDSPPANQAIQTNSTFPQFSTCLDPPQPPNMHSFSDRRQKQRPNNTQNDERVKNFYNAVHNQNRSQSKMMDLRNFNNFIKWLLIFEFSEPYQVVLDMACGKGGDLEKWRRAGVDGMIGIDIAQMSIEDAKSRYASINHKTLWVDLLAGNCFGEDIKNILHPDTPLVDSVSCQFALHYAFDTEERVRQTLSNVKSVLKNKGYFFGTILNSDYLSEKLRTGSTDWGNSIFHITFRSNHNNGNFENLTNNRYEFFLREAVENVEEFVIPFDKFTDLAEEYGFKLVKHVPFLKYFAENVVGNEVLIQDCIRKRLTDHKGTPLFDSEQLEVCSIYSVFAFVKE